MKKPIMVRVLKEFGRDWHIHSIGEVMEMDGGLRELYLRRGFIEIVESEVETAAITTHKRKRRRKTRTKVH